MNKRHLFLALSLFVLASGRGRAPKNRRHHL